MNVRPVAVSIIAWFLIVIGVLVCVVMIPPLFLLTDSGAALFVAVYALLVSVGVAATFVSGIGMLKAQNWSRWLYVIGTIAGNILNIASGQASLLMIPAFLVFLTIVFFLFRPNANRYFSRAEAA